MSLRQILLLFLGTCVFPAILPAATEQKRPPIVDLSAGFQQTQDAASNPSAIVALAEAQCWDSRHGDDANTGSFSFGPFEVKQTLELFVAGWPGEPGRSLNIKRDSDGAILSLSTRSAPGFNWVRLRWDLPASWQGVKLHLQAEDHAQGPGGWVGVSRPLKTSWQFSEAIKLLALQTLAWLILLLPGMACCTLLGEKDTAHRLVVTLVGSALCAYATFFVTFSNPMAGYIAASIILSLSLGILLVRAGKTVRLLQEREYSPILLFSLAAAVLACLGCFMYGGIESPTGIPLNRVLFGLPSDPLIPLQHAKLLVSGAPLHPFMLDWLTSDRPPLQAGLSLLGRPLIDSDLGYICIGIAAQSWVWLGLWVFMRRLGTSLRSASIVLGISLFSGFFFLNTFFCWPKLLPAAFLLCSAGLLWGRDRKDPVPLPAAVMAGICAALALLGHGGSIFGLLAMIVVYLATRRRLNKALLLAPAIAAFLTMSPWFAYQKFYDPPGDRLIKYHLAGREAIDPRPSLTVIAEAYRQTPTEVIVVNKLRNLQNQLFDRADWFNNTCIAAGLLLENKPLEAFTLFGRASREAGFYHYGQTLGPLLLGLLGLPWLLWKRGASSDAHVARISALLCLSSAVIWALMMFPRDSAIMHQSSYFTGACLFITLGLSLSVFPRKLLYALLILNVVWFILIWLIGQPLLNFYLPLNLLGSSFPAYRLLWALVALVATALLLRLAHSGEASPSLPLKTRPSSHL